MSQELQNEKIKLKFFNNDEEMLSVDNSNAVGFERVYASDPWYLAQPGFIKIKKLIICLVRHWNSIFKIADPFTLTKENQTTLPTLPSEWMVEFIFKPTNYDNPAWTSIFRNTIRGNLDNIGDRNHAIFFHLSYGLQVCCAVNKIPNSCLNLPSPKSGPRSECPGRCRTGRPNSSSCSGTRRC